MKFLHLILFLIGFNSSLTHAMENHFSSSTTRIKSAPQKLRACDGCFQLHHKCDKKLQCAKCTKSKKICTRNRPQKKRGRPFKQQPLRPDEIRLEAIYDAIAIQPGLKIEENEIYELAQQSSGKEKFIDKEDFLNFYGSNKAKIDDYAAAILEEEMKNLVIDEDEESEERADENNDINLLIENDDENELQHKFDNLNKNGTQNNEGLNGNSPLFISIEDFWDEMTKN